LAANSKATSPLLRYVDLSDSSYVSVIKTSTGQELGKYSGTFFEGSVYAPLLITGDFSITMNVSSAASTGFYLRYAVSTVVVVVVEVVVVVGDFSITMNVSSAASTGLHLRYAVRFLFLYYKLTSIKTFMPSQEPKPHTIHPDENQWVFLVAANINY
jgi:hypothetical protein